MIYMATVSADQVAVWRQDDFSQVFQAARPIKATVSEEAKLMEHPVENGSTITDHRVIAPVEIQLSLVLASWDYRDVYHSIRALFRDSTLLVVQTATGCYINMIISGLPHEESPDMMDAISLTLKLKEVVLVSASYGTLSEAEVAKVKWSSTQSH